MLTGAPSRPVPVIEVTSPSTRTIDLTEKLPDYARAGTPEHWVVDAERSPGSIRASYGPAGNPGGPVQVLPVSASGRPGRPRGRWRPGCPWGSRSPA
ncbi:MAG: Uma2 family endonuclease [Armatimonadota bacterium]|nr:Uma2 family endonuclease [Armatimonadota bacterium]MDR7595214.1 Uma2 family endonuclease [Armatimonadota bacterium]